MNFDWILIIFKNPYDIPEKIGEIWLWAID